MNRFTGEFRNSHNEKVDLMNGGNRRMRGFEGTMVSILLDILKWKCNRTTT